MRKISFSFLLIASFVLVGCTEAKYAAHVVKQIPLPGESAEPTGYFKVGNTYNIKGRRYKPQERYNLTETGIASWYGPGFHGKMTANGEIFDENEMTAAHRTLQMPSIIRVTNLSNGRTAIFRVNDRGPFAHDRILDVSKRGASVLGFKSKGTAKIRLEVLSGPSKEVAHRAKAGYSTKGYEVALTQDGRISPQSSTVMQRVSNDPAVNVPPIKPLPNMPNNPQLTTGISASAPTPLAKPLPVEAVALDTPPLPPSLGVGRIFVQAGAFSQEPNALAYSEKMKQFGPSKVYLARSGDRTLYRVRLGPYENRVAASEVIERLRNAGNSTAVIVSD
jgi:rare lipoprotein A